MRPLAAPVSHRCPFLLRKADLSPGGPCCSRFCLPDGLEASGVIERADSALRPDTHASRLTEALQPNDIRRQIQFPGQQGPAISLLTLRGCKTRRGCKTLRSPEASPGTCRVTGLLLVTSPVPRSLLLCGGHRHRQPYHSDISCWWAVPTLPCIPAGNQVSANSAVLPHPFRRAERRLPSDGGLHRSVRDR